MKRESARDRVLIGAVEAVDIPAWGVRRLPAKVDTGARTSALHVERVEELAGGRVRFDVRLHPSDPDGCVRVNAVVRRRGRVRVASGAEKPRLFVVARVRVGGVTRSIEIGLVDRRRMLYRMLLGRSALAGVFVVDPARRFVLGR
jgi:hypothetical protein